MAVIRLMLLLAVLGSLALLLVQNWSPVISLVFLGMRSQPLPLAMWILFSGAAGAVTSLAIASLLNLSNFFSGQKRRTPPKSRTHYTNTPNNPPSQEPTSRKQAPPSTTREEQPRSNEAFDDWDTDSNTINDDWDFDESTSTQRDSRSTQVQDSKTYERSKEPTTSSKSGSVYSYSYQEPKNSGVGKTESVYDADYRVIVPPHQPSTPKRADDDDDWAFFDDDNFENEKKNKR